MISFDNFVAIAIVVVCVLAPLFLLGFILRAALAVKPPRSSDKRGNTKDAP